MRVRRPLTFIKSCVRRRQQRRMYRTGYGVGTAAEYQRVRNLKMMADARRQQDGEGTGNVAAGNLAANHHVLASSEGLQCGVSWSHKIAGCESRYGVAPGEVVDCIL